MTQPASVPADGYLGVLWVPTIALPSAPTAAELTAVSVVDLSCYIVGGGFMNTLDESTVDDPRLCSRQIYERPGKFKLGLSLSYVHNPDSPADNEAYLALTYLTEGYIVPRYGIPFDDVYAATDIVDVYPAQCGKQLKVTPEDNSVLKVLQKMFITGAVFGDVVVV